MKDTKLNQDLSLLYELSLSIGNSLNIKQNCEQFLDVLIARKNLNFASVWIKNDNHINLVYGTPLNIIKDQTIGFNHYIWQKLKSKSFFFTNINHPDFRKCVQEKNINSGDFIFFNLADIGFLKLYKSDLKENEAEKFSQLIQVINKFGLLLKRCISHKKLEIEIEQNLILAEQAQLAEQQFLANVSHEIRTPMNAIIGMTHLLYETNPTETQKEYLDSLRFSTDNLMGIISTILDLSKIEANELEFEQQTFNLLELLKSLQQTFQFKVQEKPINVTLDVDSKIKNHLIGDPVRLNQILTNLLGNASKFTAKGTIGVKAKLVIATDGQYVIQFQIHDTGIGIEKNNIDKIFENFKQADVKNTRKFGGTGLGLTIVKKLVELQDGSIEVESTKDRGSIFTIILPFKDSGVLQSELSTKEDSEYQISEALKEIKLLVVEDNPMNQRLIINILNLWDCSFEIASNGYRALEKSMKEKFDIILMDIHMPDIDGCETTREIRTNAKNPNQNTTIIALTAAVLLDKKNRAFEAGMDDFLTKPFSPKQLKIHLGKWLNIETKNSKPSYYSQLSQNEIVHLDFTYLLDSCQGDHVFVKEMIEIFLKEIPIAMKQMKTELDNKNWQAIAEIAHRIKTNYMMVGLNIQKNNALDIEKSIKINDFEEEEIRSKILQLKSDSKLTYPLLKKELIHYSRIE
ncbi:MAG: ATP-binding protein [Saprospiraceae bacterium]